MTLRLIATLAGLAACASAASAALVTLEGSLDIDYVESFGPNNLRLPSIAPDDRLTFVSTWDSDDLFAPFTGLWVIPMTIEIEFAGLRFSAEGSWDIEAGIGYMFATSYIDAISDSIAWSGALIDDLGPIDAAADPERLPVFAAPPIVSIQLGYVGLPVILPFAAGEFDPTDTAVADLQYRRATGDLLRLRSNPQQFLVTAVPEPSTYGLLGAGVLLAAAAARRRLLRR